MKLRWWYGLVLNLILAALAISGAAMYVLHYKANPNWKNAPILEIRDSVTGRRYGKWPLGEKKEFAIEFIHSVHQSPVRETFTVDEKTIRPTQVRFSSFGAGMLSDLEPGQTLTHDGDALIISGFDTTFKKLDYIVGTVSDHLLIIGDEVISLQECCGENAHVTVRVRY